MTSDRPLANLEIPAAALSKLGELGIRGVRQLYARLKYEGPGLQRYLKLSDAAFDALSRRVEKAIKDDFPEDTLRKIHPQVNKSGVPVHRLHDPMRPTYNSSEEE